MHETKSWGGSSLAPSEGERAGVRGGAVLSLLRSCQQNTRAVQAPGG